MTQAIESLAHSLCPPNSGSAAIRRMEARLCRWLPQPSPLPKGQRVIVDFSPIRFAGLRWPICLRRGRVIAVEGSTALVEIGSGEYTAIHRVKIKAVRGER